MNSKILFLFSVLLTITTPLYQTDKANSISIYPNPATDHFKISDSKDLESIVIYNLIGKPVKKIDDFSENIFYIHDLQDGTYLVQFNSKYKNNVQTSRLTKRNF